MILCMARKGAFMCFVGVALEEALKEGAGLFMVVLFLSKSSYFCWSLQMNCQNGSQNIIHSPTP